MAIIHTGLCFEQCCADQVLHASIMHLYLNLWSSTSEALFPSPAASGSSSVWTFHNLDAALQACGVQGILDTMDPLEVSASMKMAY
jgi:hypothetical protein